MPLGSLVGAWRPDGGGRRYGPGASFLEEALVETTGITGTTGA